TSNERNSAAPRISPSTKTPRTAVLRRSTRRVAAEEGVGHMGAEMEPAARIAEAQHMGFEVSEIIGAEQADLELLGLLRGDLKVGRHSLSSAWQGGPRQRSALACFGFVGSPVSTRPM